MSQIQQIHKLSVHRRLHSDMTRVFESRFCPGPNITVQGPLRDPAKHVDITKPRLWLDPKSRLWSCQLDTVRGTGTTQRAAWSQMWALLKITHPWLRKPYFDLPEKK